MAEAAQKTLESDADSLYRDTDELPLFLELKVKDRETIRALLEHPEGPQRDEYALEALKIGVLALRHATARLDADLIQREGSLILDGLRRQLEQHSSQVHEQLTGELKNYFDPESGRFQERVERLVKRDGELEQLLRRQIGGEDSQLAKTLLAHLGEHSPLMKMLDPQESKGLLAALTRTVDDQLRFQRDRLLREFSLDNGEGALARLVAELTKNHGQLSVDLKQKIDEVMKEFSLDEENSALKRLVDNVDTAQKKICEEFSLDNKASALARLKDELLTILSAHVETNAKFQEEVKVALGKLVGRREEAARSTRHGVDFESAVFEFFARECQNSGDVATHTGDMTGRIRNCKVGDVLIELGPESAAPGGRIIIEAKEVKKYTLARAREEMETARKNWDAHFGLFIFSSKTTTEGLDALARYGNDVMVVWDAEEAHSDLHLKAGLTVAKALCVRGHQMSKHQVTDFQAIDIAILEIEKRATALEEIRKWAESIKNNSDKILQQIDTTGKSLARQVATLNEKIADLKESITSGDP